MNLFDKRLFRNILALLGVAVLAFGLWACKEGSPVETTGSTDEMFSDDAKDVEFYVFEMEGKTIQIGDYYYNVDVVASTPLEDGHFYKVVADVRYLNGGIAGYVNYPEIKNVKSCVEVSPDDLNLPSVKDQPYGLVRLDDDYEGDILYLGIAQMGVWKDGEWIRTFKRVVNLPDGTNAGVAPGVTKDDVAAGIENGVLSCDDYYAVLPQS